MLKNNILKLPDYIKIDVDGLEHLILRGADKILRSKKIKSVSIELNDNYKYQLEFCKKIMKKNKFIFKTKLNSEIIKNSKKFNKTYNYIFEKNG